MAWPTKSNFNQKKFDRICLELCKGRSLRSICKDRGMPAESTVRMWVYIPPAGLDASKIHAQYWNARKVGMWAMVDETIEIADNAVDDMVEKTRKDGSTYTSVDYEVITRSALRVKQRNWLAERILRSDLGEGAKPAEDNKITIVGGLPED